jgi:glycosyltransferase involved in cell wall biosynthesis
MKKLAVVNRYYPPSPASTGDLAHELVHQLQQILTGYEVFVVTTDAPYKGGWRGQLNITERVVRTQVYYKGNNQILRFLSGFLEGRKMAKLAFSQADVVISMTNPPLVNFWMGRYSNRFSKRYIEWTLDVFPVAFAQSGHISEKNPIYRYFLRKCSRFTPDFNLFLGDGQRKLVQKAFNYENPYAILPCGIKDTPTGPEPTWKKNLGNKVVLGYVGNLGEAHSSDVLVKLVREADPAVFHFVFCMYGAKVEGLREAVGDDTRISWVENIPDSDLTHMDIHLVTLLEEWTHISVPSKTVSAVCMGKPILFMGNASSDNWEMFSEAGWRVDPSDPTNASITQVLGEISNEELREQRIQAAFRAAEDLRRLEHDSIRRLADWIAGESAR